MDRDDDRDDSITEARITGVSTRALAKVHGCTSREVEAAFDRRLDFVLDSAARLRAVKLSTARLEALMVPFFENAQKGDAQAGLLCVKIEERLSLLLGTDHPTTSRVDVYQVEAAQKPSQHQLIHDAIMRVVEQAPPAQRALRKRLEQLDPETALALLNAGDGGPGAVDGLSDFDDDKTRN